jgi:hypothetical protein
MKIVLCEVSSIHRLRKQRAQRENAEVPAISFKVLRFDDLRLSFNPRLEPLKKELRNGCCGYVGFADRARCEKFEVDVRGRSGLMFCE